MRFLVVIKSPTHIWTDYEVIDIIKCVVMATCTSELHAEQIASALNSFVPDEAVEMSRQLTMGDK